MYALVADIERYPEFLPWCVALRVVDRRREGPAEALTADMVVAYGVFRERFRSHVMLNEAMLCVTANYVHGPFKSLRNAWTFVDSPTGGSVVDFSIAFEFRSALLQATAQAVFEKAFARMSEAFVGRADEIYGAGRRARWP
jgi:coenzyme Q-binding protein COQ10